MIPVALLTTTGQCADPLRQLEQSPFRSRQQARVDDVLRTRKSELLALAGAKPLIVLDIGFNSNHGSQHGRKVRIVAERVLEALGAGDLADKIVPVELYPTNAAAHNALEDALDNYVASQPTPAESSSEFALRVKEATEWLKSSAAAAVIAGPRLDVPEVLLRAVFWSYVTRGSVLNMSFRMHAPATARLLNDWAETAVSLNVAGVGNTVELIRQGWTPQDAAMAQSNVVTVTYGTVEGELKAEFGSHDEIGPRVVLLAPGCGFQGVQESGSSLASPYVAAASWLRLLLDEVEGQKPAVADFWRELLMSTTPIPTLVYPVESGGMFDPVMLIAAPRADHFMVKRDGTIVELHKLQAVAECASADGTFPMLIPSEPPERQSVHSTYAVIATSKGTLLWRRTTPIRGRGRGKAETVCKLADLSFRATSSGGASIEYPVGDKARFASEVVLFSW
jgi:hypothetical protein